MSKGFGDSELAQEQGEKANNQIIEKVLQQDREQADHARELQQAGRYGYCEDCGAKIDPDRLSVLPDSTRCMTCQGAWENAGR
jgi:DnaK suppressor protein